MTTILVWFTILTLTHPGELPAGERRAQVVQDMAILTDSEIACEAAVLRLAANAAAARRRRFIHGRAPP